MNTEQAIAEAISIEYSEWKDGRRSREPQLTAAGVASLVNPALFEESPRLSERKRLLGRVSTALGRMRRAGRVGVSLGSYRGREARMFEPNEAMRRAYTV